MKLAIVGSRSLTIENLCEYLPQNVEEIVSGGARGIDTAAKTYARQFGIKYTEFLPEYEKFGRAAPLKRNDAIIQYADSVLIFWNGTSRGTKYVIDQCTKQNKPHKIYIV